MNINDAFPSNYVKAREITHPLTVTIETVELEDLDGEHKPVIYFRGAKKGLVLNKTNAQQLATFFGDETDGWIGHKIQLYTDSVMYQGQMVPGIRIRGVEGTQAPPAPPPAQPLAELNDDIPF